MRVYLAGPMRGYPDFNFPAFHIGARRLRDLGYEVFSPAERDIEAHGEGVNNSPTCNLDDVKDTGFSLRDALAADTQWISLRADAVVVLPGWQESKGAQAEVALARALGLPVWSVDEVLSGFLSPGPRAA